MLAFRKNPLTAKWMALTLSAALLLAGCQKEDEGKDDCAEKSKGIMGALFGNSDKDKDKGKGKCEKPGDDDDQPAPTPDPTPSPDAPLQGLPGRECTIDRFKQNKEEQIVKKVDILFVMDHSGSMQDDWARVANNVQELVKELPSDIDVRYAVLLANGSAWMGKLYAPAKIPVVMSNQTMKIQEISQKLHKTFTEGMKVGDNNTGGEGSFLSLYHAVTSRASDNQKAGFFRPDAALSVLFMSDEHEIGSPFPNPQAPGLPPRCDTAWEDNAKKVHYDSKGINLDVTFNAMKALKGDMPVVTHAFVNITKEDLFKRNSKNASCLYDSLGYGYFEAVEKTKGVLFSIQENKAEGLSRCGRVIKERLQIVKDFPLSKPADQVDPETILAHVDNAASAHTYSAATNIVHLENAGVFGSEIAIRHCAPVARQEWTLQGFTGQAGQYAASLSWKTPELATNGKILWGVSESDLSQETAGQGTVTDHVVTVQGLTPNTVYYFQASSRDEYGEEKRSSVISLRTQPDWSIGAVGGQPSRNSVSVSWKTPEYATKGRVLYGIDGNALVNSTVETAAANEHQVTVNGLDPSTTYYFQVVAKDEYGLEKKSAVVPVDTLTDWAIVGFQGEAARNSASLQWQTPEYATAGKVVWGLSPASLSGQAASAGVGNNHQVTVNGLSADTTYYFQAVSLDDLGVEKRSSVIALRTIKDWALTGFAGTSTVNSVSVSWKTGEYATTGRILWGATAESLDNQVVTNGASTEHVATISGLNADTVYYFQAVSSDNLGVTRASEVVAIRTQREPVVNPEWEMTDFIGHADKTWVSVGWKTADYATTGKVLWGTSENSLTNELSESAAVKDHSVLVEGLTPDTLYYFQAVSTDDHGQEKRTAVIALRTLADDQVPPPVTDWEVKSFDATTTPTSADVIWQTPGAMTKATIKVGLSPDNLTHMSVPVDDYAETHLVPVTGLSPNTAYYLQVIAVDTNGRTVESVVIMKRTKVQ